MSTVSDTVLPDSDNIKNRLKIEGGGGHQLSQNNVLENIAAPSPAWRWMGNFLVIIRVCYKCDFASATLRCSKNAHDSGDGAVLMTEYEYACIPLSKPPQRNNQSIRSHFDQ